LQATIAEQTGRLEAVARDLDVGAGEVPWRVRALAAA